VTTQSEILPFEELTPAARRNVYWGFIWRGAVVSIAGAIGGAILGGVLGFIFGYVGSALGHDVHQIMALIRVVGALVGLVWGLFLIPYLVRWIFRIKSGLYVIRLIRLDDSSRV
jgi:hypothetical protein